MEKTKLLIISGSQRQPSASGKLADYLTSNKLSSMDNIESRILDVSRYTNLLDHYSVNGESNELVGKEKSEVLEYLYWCDCVIFIAPEWGGMIPPALVNTILLTANGSANGLPLGHKPGYVIGVSASSGGANPVSLLKAYAAKNSHVTWLSLHAIVNNVEDFISRSWAPEDDDRISQVQSRIDLGINALVIYAQQLKPVREKLINLTTPHPFGQ